MTMGVWFATLHGGVPGLDTSFVSFVSARRAFPVGCDPIAAFRPQFFAVNSVQISAFSIQLPAILAAQFLGTIARQQSVVQRS